MSDARMCKRDIVIWNLSWYSECTSDHTSLTVPMNTMKPGWTLIMRGRCHAHPCTAASDIEGPQGRVSTLSLGHDVSRAETWQGIDHRRSVTKHMPMLNGGALVDSLNYTVDGLDDMICML